MLGRWAEELKRPSKHDASHDETLTLIVDGWCSLPRAGLSRRMGLERSTINGDFSIARMGIRICGQMVRSKLEGIHCWFNSNA